MKSMVRVGSSTLSIGTPMGLSLSRNGYADADVVDAGNQHDVAGLGFLQRHAFQASLKPEQLVDAALGDLFCRGSSRPRLGRG